MKALLIGIGVGVGVGLLVAPASGDVTRGKVWDRITRTSDWFEEGPDEVKGGMEQADGSATAKTQDAGETESWSPRPEH